MTRRNAATVLLALGLAATGVLALALWAAVLLWSARGLPIEGLHP